MSISVVIGANRGIGLEMCRQLKERGEEVVAVCRHDRDGELGKLGVQLITDIDVTKASDMEKLSHELDGQVIKLLIHNAGVLESNSLDNLDFESIEKQFFVNSMGPLRSVSALRHLIHEGGKVGIVTSRMGSIEDNGSGGSYGYRMSKAAANAAGRSLAHDLKSKNIAVALLHPGYVRTDMTGHSGHIDPPEAATGLLERMDELTLEKTGQFWHQNGEQLPW